MPQKTLRHVRKDLKNIAYPYLFILSEGKTINENPMDYDLTMFLSYARETLPSPTQKRKKRLSHKQPLAANATVC